MTIKNPASVHDYISMVEELRSALDNLAEFVGTLPAPDDDMHIPGMDYPQLADVRRLHELIGEACQITCEISE